MSEFIHLSWNLAEENRWIKNLKNARLHHPVLLCQVMHPAIFKDKFYTFKILRVTFETCLYVSNCDPESRFIFISSTTLLF